MKVVILEECDNLTNDAWSSLRATIEQFHSHVRFIANCNYIEKVPEPIQSRFNCIPLEPVNMEEETFLLNGYEERVKLILNACHIASTDENIKTFVKNSFPDMRTLIKKIQQLYTRGWCNYKPCRFWFPSLPAYRWVPLLPGCPRCDCLIPGCCIRSRSGNGFPE